MIKKTAIDAIEYLCGLHFGWSVAALTALALLIGLGIKLAKRIGIVPVILVPLILGGVFMAGKYSATALTGRAETPAPAAKPAEKAVEPTVAFKPSILGSLIGKAVSSGTRVKLANGTPTEPGSTLGLCGYCKSMLSISGGRGADVIACPNCGGTFPALKAIRYLDYCNQRGYY